MKDDTRRMDGTSCDGVLRKGERPVAKALTGAAAVLPERPRSSSLPVEARDGSWEKWGIHGLELEAEEYAAMRAYVEHKVRAMVSAGGWDRAAAA